MTLSIVIINWNDLKVLRECLSSIFETTKIVEFEVIISDNGSTDGSLDFIRENYPQVKVLENGTNLGFARGNNVGIEVASGEYVLILNPDTIIHSGAIDGLVQYADQHHEAGAFGCRVENPDGTFQMCARPFPTVGRYLIVALGIRSLMHLSDSFVADRYLGWTGDTEREIDWQLGACVLVRGKLLEHLGGFDERFFYHFEEVDLCKRIWTSGSKILYFPGATITHLGGQSTGRFPIRFAIEKFRNRYRYFEKHFGIGGAYRCRCVSLLNLCIRYGGYWLRNIFSQSESLENRLKMYRVLIQWNLKLDVEAFLRHGEEPDVGYEPIIPAGAVLATK